MDRRTLPTVVVARRPLAGREREFEQWLRRLASAAERMPGHLGTDVQPPGPSHPSEWVTIYRFDSAEHLGDWLGSGDRRALMRDGESLVDGPAREQVVAMEAPAGSGHPVTAVASFTLRPDAGSAMDDFYRRLLSALSTFDGFLHCDLFEPVPGVQEETVIVFAFDGRLHLDAWLESPERADVLARIDPFVEGERVLNVVGGFGGWFAPGAVRRWKQAAIVLLALFPTSLLLSALRQEMLPDLALVPAVFVTNVLGIVVLTWVLMPWLTGLFDRWLRR